MSVNIGLRLKYQDLFDDKPLAFEDYFQGMSKEVILQAISLLVNAAHPSNEFHDSTRLINMWFSEDNKELMQKILGKLPPNGGIVNIISSLKLVEYVLENEFPEEQTISNADLEINLLKAYLLLNNEQEAIENEAFKKVPPKGQKENGPATMLAINFHDSDLTNYDIWKVLVPQILKSIEFLTYMESRKELYPHLNYFLKMFDCATWQDWLKQYLAVVLPAISSKEKSFFDFEVVKDDNYEKNCAFLETLIANDATHTKKDFITLRSSPLIKIEDGTFRVVNKLFLIEKMFKSIQFLFSLKINSKLPKAQRIDFKGKQGDYFSEQILLYKTIKNSFPKKWVHFPGEEIKKFEYQGEPDYYLRFKNKIFLFESKDVVLTGEEKQSRNFEILSKALKKKFYKIEEEDGKVEKKAILQIIENVKRTLDKYYDRCDVDYNPHIVKIYPILVTHDRQFDTLGVNKLLMGWFQTELDKIKGDYNISNVKPLVVLNIDSLLLHQELLKTRGKIRLEDLIDGYLSEINLDNKKVWRPEELFQKLQDSFIPFYHFVDKRIDKLKLKKIPSILREYVGKLFD